MAAHSLVIIIIVSYPSWCGRDRPTPHNEEEKEVAVDQVHAT